MTKEILSKPASKRQFLKGLTALMGATAVSQLTSNNALAVAFNYQRSSGEIVAGKLFSIPQMQILHDICAVVLPETDTPSAAQLDVHGFIDHQLVVCHSNEEQQMSKSFIERLDKVVHSEFKLGFSGLSSVQQHQLLTDLEAQKRGFTLEDKQVFKGLKSLLVFGYFTSEVGATQVLSYQAVPVGFKGSIPYESVGKSYGSLAYYR